eukprot:1860062-Amphidinium_carterae.1
MLRCVAALEEAVDLLRSWDGDLRADSVPAALYQLAHAELVKVLLQGACQVAETQTQAQQCQQIGLGTVLDKETTGELQCGSPLECGVRFCKSFQGSK